MQYRRYTVDFKKYSDGTQDNLQGPPSINPNIKNPPALLKKFQALDADGVAKISSEVSTGDIIVNKQVPVAKTNAEISLTTEAAP